MKIALNSKGSDTFLQASPCRVPSTAEKNLAKAKDLGIPQSET